MSILPSQKGLEIPGGGGGGGGGGSQRQKIVRKCMELNWKFQRGGGRGLRKNPFRWGGMDNFWNHTIYDF